MVSSLWSVYSLAAVITFLAAAYYLYERRGVSTREAAVIASLAALAGLSRVPLAGFPGVQPTTFMVIISGAVFGPGAGFMVGSLAAVVSNMVLGQGPWTPWQMLAWGFAGLSGGLMQRFFGATKKTESIENSGNSGVSLFVAEGDIAEGDIVEGDITEGDIVEGDVTEGDIADSINNHVLNVKITGYITLTGKIVMVLTAFFWGFLFGWFMNTWHWLTFVYPHTWQTFFLTHLTSLWFDLLHAISNAIFMIVAGGEMIKILKRFQRRLTYKTIERQ